MSQGSMILKGVSTAIMGQSLNPISHFKGSRNQDENNAFENHILFQL